MNPQPCPQTAWLLKQQRGEFAECAAAQCDASLTQTSQAAAGRPEWQQHNAALAGATALTGI